MIVKEEFLNKLRQYFHLNLYEVKIWTALLSRGVSTAGELSDIGEVPRSRAYDILESLEKKGFVVLKLGKPIKYIAVDPQEVVERVKKFVRTNAEVSVKRLDELRGTDVLKELDHLHNQGIEFIEPTDLSGAIRGRHNLYSHLEAMMKNATKSVTIMATEKGVIRKIESLKPLLERLNRKGVSIKIAAPITKDNLEFAKSISKVGEIRQTTNPEARFCIVDSKELTFMLLHDDNIHPGYDVGVWVKTPFFASAVQTFFNNSWKNMTALDKVKL